MAWPVSTRATDDLITAAIWNADIAGNMNSLMHLIARKTADQSVVSSTTEVADTALQVPLLANEIWKVQFCIRYTGNTTGNFKMGFTFPTGATIDASTYGYTAGAVFDMMRWSAGTSPSPSLNFVNIATGNLITYIEVNGVVVTGGTAGTLIMQWAQNTSNGTATVVKANSSVWGVKLA